MPRGHDGLAVASERDPRAVEYAVVMDRYDDSTTLNAHLADGRATEADLVAVGAAIAGFHAASPVETDVDSGGLAAVLDETLATLRRVGAPMGRLAELARFCGAALAGFGPELTRPRAGRAASATATATCARSTSSSAPTSKPSTASSSTAPCASPTSATTSPS